MIGLIARRELATRLQQRSYRISLAVTIVIVAIVCVLPKFFGSSGTKSYDVGVSGTDAASVSTAFGALATQQGVRVHVQDLDADTARERVKNGKLDVAVIDDREVVAATNGSDAVRLAQAAHQSVVTTQRLAGNGLTPAQAQDALAVSTLPVTATRSSESGQRQAVATIAVVILFSQLITYITWVAYGVVEEKSSRVVELLLAAVRPTQLLTGKLVGIGTLAVAQVGLIGIVALGSTTLAGTLDIGASAYVSIVVAFVGFVLGFAFFAAVAAALASTVSRQEELGGVLFPVTGSLTLSYLASIAVANAPDSGFARVLSILPPVSSLAMPARIARGDVPALEVGLAVVLILLATIAMVIVGGRIYRAAVLHTGSKVSLKRAWRGEAVAGLS